VIRSILLTAVIAFAVPALADGPAAMADPGVEGAETSFNAFAKRWMDRVHRLEAQGRSKPTVSEGSDGPVVSYRGYGDDFSIELRETGYARAPYVGLLRYVEHVYSCTSLAAKMCRRASSIPVTEIFRFQDGSWAY
jgi:hypothetical protein